MRYPTNLDRDVELLLQFTLNFGTDLTLAAGFGDGDLNLMSRSTSQFSLCSPRATLPNSAILSIPNFSAFSFLKDAINDTEAYVAKY